MSSPDSRTPRNRLALVWPFSPLDCHQAIPYRYKRDKYSLIPTGSLYLGSSTHDNSFDLLGIVVQRSSTYVYLVSPNPLNRPVITLEELTLLSQGVVRPLRRLNSRSLQTNRSRLIRQFFVNWSRNLTLAKLSRALFYLGLIWDDLLGPSSENIFSNRPSSLFKQKITLTTPSPNSSSNSSLEESLSFDKSEDSAEIGRIGGIFNKDRNSCTVTRVLVESLVWDDFRLDTFLEGCYLRGYEFANRPLGRAHDERPLGRDCGERPLWRGCEGRPLGRTHEEQGVEGRGQTNVNLSWFSQTLVPVGSWKIKRASSLISPPTLKFCVQELNTIAGILGQWIEQGRIVYKSGTPSQDNRSIFQTLDFFIETSQPRYRSGGQPSDAYQGELPDKSRIKLTLPPYMWSLNWSYQLGRGIKPEKREFYLMLSRLYQLKERLPVSCPLIQITQHWYQEVYGLYRSLH